MKSGLFPRSEERRVGMELCSRSSWTELNWYTMAPTYSTLSGPGTYAVPVWVVHAPGFSHGPGGSALLQKSAEVMVASVEQKRSPGALPPAVPWLQYVTVTCTWLPAVALGAVLTWVTMKSGLFPTPTRFPAAALLSSISSCTELSRSAMAPT